METNVEKSWYIVVENVNTRNGEKERVKAFFMSESEVPEYKLSHKCVSFTKKPLWQIEVFLKYGNLSNSREVAIILKKISKTPS